MSNPQLILLRHAKSDWHSDAIRDFDRPLGPRGIRDAPRVGRWLHFSGLRPTLIVCSSAVRARETLRGVASQLNLDKVEIQYSGGLYMATESEVAEIAARALATADRVMLVGHNPGLEMALIQYCPDVPVPPDGKLMPTGCVAAIEFDAAGEAHLLHLRRPEK